MHQNSKWILALNAKPVILREENTDLPWLDTLQLLQIILRAKSKMQLGPEPPTSPAAKGFLPCHALRQPLLSVSARSSLVLPTLQPLPSSSLPYSLLYIPYHSHF